MTDAAIIGSESTHARVYVHLFNVAGVVPDLRISALCPDTPEQGEELCRLGGIARTARDPALLAGACDAALVLHRDAARHADAALPFLRAGLPVFVDKPLAPTIAEAMALLAEAAEHGAAITSFSVMTMQHAWTRRIAPSLAELGPLERVTIDAPGDSNSPWGGILFYGIHAAEILHAAAPGRAHSVTAYSEGPPGSVRLEFEGDQRAFRGTIRLHAAGSRAYRIGATGPGGTLAEELDLDPDPYLTAAAQLGRFLQRHAPGRPAADMLAPLALIEAAHTSLARGRRAAVRTIDTHAG